MKEFLWWNCNDITLKSNPYIMLNVFTCRMESFKIDHKMLVYIDEVKKKVI